MTSTRTRKTVTRRDAERVLTGVRKAYAAWIDSPADGPQIVEDFDYCGPVAFAIVWEGGPYDWALLASMGGVDEEFGGRYDAVQAPAGLFLEAITGWALGVHVL